MKKSSVILFITILLCTIAGFIGGYFINDNLSEKKEVVEQEEPVKEEDIFEKLLKGDFSGVAGEYESKNGNTGNILLNGTISFPFYIHIRFTDPIAREDGTYMWGVIMPGHELSSEMVIIYPPGVKAFDGEKFIDEGLSTIRFSMSNGYPREEDILYKK